MSPIERPGLINKAFVRLLAVFAVAIGALQLLLEWTPMRALPSILAAKMFLVGAIVLHKRLVAADWLYGTASNMGAFLRGFFVYALPASILWAQFVAGLSESYLPRAGFILHPFWRVQCITIGVLVLGRSMLSHEMMRLGKPKTGEHSNLRPRP